MWNFVCWMMAKHYASPRNVTGARLKRWKVGSLNKTTAKQQEAIIKTDLMKGSMRSDQDKPVLFKDWGLRYLELEEVRRLRSYRDRDRIVKHQLIPFLRVRIAQ